MINIRTWHSYLSAFVAPSILFFALTGAVQLFNLHEAHGGYEPAALIEKLGRLHKDQVFALDERPAHEESNPSPPPAVEEHAPDDHGKEPPVSTYVLKWFFLVVALALAVSTCLGMWIALTHIKRKRVSALLLVAGTLLPVALLAF